MKHFKIGFLAILAIATMSFTVISNSDFTKKRVNVKDCYTTVTGDYLTGGSWASISSSTAIGDFVRNNLSYGNYTTTNVICNGGSTICCVRFIGDANDPSGTLTDEMKGDGVLVNNAGSIISANDFVKVNAIYFTN